jgi:hypothetical protein
MTDQPIDREPIDYDELGEMHAELRDHLLASDLVALAEHDQDGAREVTANLVRVIRHAADSMRRAALVIRRSPQSAHRVADGLDDMAGMLDELVLGRPAGAAPSDD